MEPSQCPDSEQQINSQQLIYFANRHITLRAETSINQHEKKKMLTQQLVQHNRSADDLIQLQAAIIH